MSHITKKLDSCIERLTKLEEDGRKTKKKIEELTQLLLKENDHIPTTNRHLY